ncbi:MAG TPA: hypothetical protein VKQ08_00865, partial [Cyclobacteriaceae bacterium]|nr:hypothetical protein [Cyclobacteriaceae bacterium]
MFYNLSAHGLIFGLVGALVLYAVILGITYGKKLLNLGKHFGIPLVQTSGASIGTVGGLKSNTDHFPPLIDKPADHPSEQAVYDEPQ